MNNLFLMVCIKLVNPSTEHALVLLDILKAVLLVADPLGWVVPTQPLDQVGGAAGNLPRELDDVDAPEDDVVGLHGVVGREGRTAKNENK